MVAFCWFSSFSFLFVFVCVLLRRVLSCFPSEKGLGSLLFHFFVFCVFCGFVASAFRFVSIAVSWPFVFFAFGLVCRVCVFVSLRFRCLSVLASRALRVCFPVVGLRVFPSCFVCVFGSFRFLGVPWFLPVCPFLLRLFKMSVFLFEIILSFGLSLLLPFFRSCCFCPCLREFPPRLSCVVVTCLSVLVS